MSGEDVRLLHAVLNFHLPPPSDQLPTAGADASSFGPRTEAKVKAFQELNRIDFGQLDYKDGVVGPHTLGVLQSGAKIVFRVGLDPTELPAVQAPPTSPASAPPSPILPKLKAPVLMPPAPQPSYIPAPRLYLDNFQLQAGASHTFNFTRWNTDSMFLQAQWTLLWKSQGPHTEISLGGVQLYSLNSNQDGNDVQFYGQVTRAQIPIFDKLTLSLFGQMTLQNMRILKPFNPSAGVGVGAQFQWEFVENKFMIAAQEMPFFNLINENDSFKVLTGFQGQGFLIFQFDAGSR
jgi:hypothetical protein